MKSVSLVFFFFPVLILGCTAATQSGPSEASPQPAQTQTAGAEHSVTGKQCEIPEGLLPSNGDPGIPQIADPSHTIEVERVNTVLVADERGDLEVSLQILISNPSQSACSFVIGYSRRVPWDYMDKRFEDLRIEARAVPIDETTCIEPSPTNLQQPFRTWAHYARVEMVGGSSSVIEIAYRTALERADKPMTLFGFHDRFTRNWKNWDWAYTKTEAFAQIAPKLSPFHGAFVLGEAAQTRVASRTAEPGCRFGGLSHEQSVRVEQGTNAFAWEFGRDDRPDRVEFEVVCGIDAEEEIQVFSRIAKSRPNDLRARIRLAQLYYFSGDLQEREKVLKQLLEVWEANAQKQMLTRRNDVRGAAYVALVRTLQKLGQSQRAKQAARDGVALLDALESEYDKEVADLNGLARKWLADQ